nr:zinc knuckle CX2CX4HX4C [Tanacetum cinerariifolium]
MPKGAPIVDDNLSSKASPNNLFGACTKEQPKVSSNFHSLVADVVFNGVNIFIQRKVIEKAGLEDDLENGPWMIHNTRIILKKEDGISLIATFIGKPIMLDSYTSTMYKDACGRSSFACCLIKVKLEADLMEVVTIDGDSLIVSTSNVEKAIDDFQTVAKKKKRKGKSKSTNGEEEKEEVVENAYDETTNLFPNTKIGGGSSIMTAVG